MTQRLAYTEDRTLPSTLNIANAQRLSATLATFNARMVANATALGVALASL